IIVDGDNGQILYEKNANESLPPASMTKMMTQYLVLEEIAKGKIAWDTKTGISEYAYWISNEKNFSGIGLKKKKEYSVKSLYKAMEFNSNNEKSVKLPDLLFVPEKKLVN